MTSDLPPKPSLEDPQRSSLALAAAVVPGSWSSEPPGLVVWTCSANSDQIGISGGGLDPGASELQINTAANLLHQIKHTMFSDFSHFIVS